MGPRSRSRSPAPRGAYSRSPDRRGRRYASHNISKSRHPPSPPPLPPGKHGARRRSDETRRSFSRSQSPRYHRRYNSSRRPKSRTCSRSRSRSPYDRNNQKNRENPSPSRCLGVFGLSVNTTQQKIREIFSKYGHIERIHVVIDAQTGRSRGFCFIYYRDLQDAADARDNCSGLEIDGRRIRVAYSTTKRPHTPTPGVYKGGSVKGMPERYRTQQRRHSPSPYNRSRRDRYERSRSRSHSPRRHRY